MSTVRRYNDFATWLRRAYGRRVQKVTVDAGMTCPNRDGTVGRGGCIYCNARGSGSGAYARGECVADQLRAGIARASAVHPDAVFIAYFQSFSNTYAESTVLERLWDEALSVDGVVGLSIGTRPDCINDSVLSLLERYAARCDVWVEYGLQSVHDSTLQTINRGHDAAVFHKAVIDTRARGVKVCAHIILGLPGEGSREMLQTADSLARLPVDGLKIHNLYVVPGTAMEVLLNNGTYECMTQRAYVEAVVDILERLPPEIVIQRLTGDPPHGERCAPSWAGQKNRTLSAIRDLMQTRDSWQGKALGFLVTKLCDCADCYGAEDKGIFRS